MFNLKFETSVVIIYEENTVEGIYTIFYKYIAEQVNFWTFKELKKELKKPDMANFSLELTFTEIQFIRS